ncbi:MAG: hypothetical protein EOO24_03320 [Comamonadaceae bacterium]|nr:MAG: hypothetical protein EOO24_03320 [Comamonadaceae bacterium]
MPRRLFAIVIAFVLSCYGFAALAHGVLPALGHARTCQVDAGAGAAPIVHSSSAVDEGTDGIVAELPDPGEIGTDFAEMVDAGQRPGTAVLLPAAPAAVQLASGPHPLLERPKRPPRASAPVAA